MRVIPTSNPYPVAYSNRFHNIITVTYGVTYDAVEGMYYPVIETRTNTKKPAYTERKALNTAREQAQAIVHNYKKRGFMARALRSNKQ